MRESDGSGDVLKGPLSDVFVPALLEGSLPALGKRLGDRAQLCDPRFGTATGSELGKRLAELRTAWAGFTAEKERIVAGIERDVWVGTLTNKDRVVYLALGVERRRMREIEIRMYHTYDKPYVFTHTNREQAALPLALEAALAALESGNSDELTAELDPQATLKTQTGASFMRDKVAQFLAAVRGEGNVTLERHGSADDGRSAAAELTLTRGAVGSSLVLVASRGESGLITSLRLIG